jgi:hypothetical protein
MAAIYDPQGNYMGDDGAPDLDQMKLELVKKNQPLSLQIPGYGRPVPQSQTPPDPLGAAAGNFTELATKFNPLMMAKSMREAAGMLTVPPVAAIKGVGESLLTSPPGTYMSGKAPDYAEQVAKQFMQQNAPQTPMAQEFAGAVAPYMAELPAYLGHLQTGRPAFTPNDLRVMGAEATRVGRQVKDIPTDFYNAQSGLQKLDPITGQPTYGAKLQGVAESVGDIMAQREMQGLPPIPGLPASMQPMNPKLYAMRPEGSRVTTATIPATAKQDAATYTPARDLVRSVISDATMTPIQALDEIQYNILGKPESASARRAFESFLKTKANEMFPDAPSEGAALAAYKTKFGDRASSAAHSLEMYDEFLQTPKGMQYRAELDLPSAEELPAMHEAAANWLNSQFTNYIIEKVGTPNEPAAKLASQGLTFVPPSDVFDLSTGFSHSVGAKRTAAGMPAKTPTDEALVAANQQLSDLVQQSADAATRKRDQETIAKQLGYGAIDPNTGVVVEGMNLGRYEPFAQASRESDKANAAYKKQQKVVDNLRLGSAYEAVTDTAISADTAKGLKEDLDYGERQFYPALMQTPDAERVYTASPSRLRELGFGDLAKSFYNDVMSRKIKLDKVPKMTVEKYIRDTAEGRIAEEKLAQAKEKQFKIDADNQFARSAALHIPNDKVFGNVGALEITNRFTPEEVAKLVSEDTLALDVCIGEGGNVRGKPNPWHPGTGDRQYIPIYDIVTGQRNPDATSPRGSYINAVAQGSQMVSFRDTVTGEPVAIFDFNPSASGKYDINFASGRRNKEVKPAYVEGIKSYLNSREDSIRGVSHNLNDNLDIYDSKRMSNSALADVINMPVSEFKKYDVSNLPRFITRTDLRNYIEALQADEPPVPVPAIMSQRPSESLDAYVAGAVSSSIDNVLDTVRRELEEAGEDHQTSTAVAFFEDTRDHFNRYLQAEGPVRALDRAKQRLYDLENEYANSPRIVSNIIAEGIADLMDDISGYTDYARNRQAAEAAQPRAVAQQGDPMPNMDASELIAQYPDRLSYDQVDWLQEFGDRWEGEEGNTDAGREGLIDEFARWRDTNRLRPEDRPDYLRMTHDAALAADRQWGVQTADEVRAALRFISEGRGEIDGPLDPANDTDAYIRALRQQADAAVNGSAEIVLNELADEMESAYIRDWEPADEQPPARQTIQPFDWVGALDSIVNEVSQNTNPGVGNRVDTIAHRLAERRNPRLDPVGYARALRDLATTDEHVAVGPALRALADQMHPLEAPPTLRAADLDNQRNDRIFQLENAVNDPELNPEDLRFLANELSHPLNPAANNHWISLAETERRDYAQALRQRANYIEFNPRDFAQRLIGEEGPEHYDDAITLLQNNDYDHEVLRRLPPIERARAAQATALEMQRLLEEPQLRALNPNGVPPAPAPNLTQMPMADLMSQITQMDNDTGGVWRRVNENTEFALRIARRQGADPATVGQAISQGAFVDPDTTPAEREYIARVIAQNLRDDAEYAARNQPPEVTAIVPAEITPADRDLYDEFNAVIRNAIRDEDFEPNNHTSDELAEWVLNDEVGGLDDLTTEQRHRLSALVREYGYGGTLPLGFANGGPVRGYQAGGTVKKPDVPTPYLFSVPTYSETVAYEMYPGQKGQDDQRDAARHMLAAGTLSRKYSPGVAEFLGKAHEFTTSPLQAVKSLFGGQMPADYGMDTHNNAVGAQLGQRAKSQAELEDLVQAEAERASRTQTQGQAFIKKANGGIVQENPTTDQMRYALTMRRK